MFYSKKVAVFLLIGLLAGCSSKPPAQIQPSGKLTPINQKQFELNERA